MVAPEVAGFAQSPVAGNEPGDRVTPHRSADCPDCLGGADGLRDFAVGGDVARGDLQEGFPDFDLERGPDEVEGGRAVGAFCPKSCVDPRTQAHRVFHIGGFGPAAGEVCHRRLAALVFREGEPADAFVGTHEECGAEGAFEPAPENREACTAFGEVAGAHRFPCEEHVVQAAGAGEADCVCCGQGCEFVAQEGLGMPHGQILLVAFGRHPNPLREHPLEMSR